MLSNKDYYYPEEALSRIHEQQAMLKTAMDIQVVLQLLIKHGLVSQDEIAEMRLKVAELPTYKATLDSLNKEEAAMKYAVNHPEDHLKAILNAKMNGELK